MQLQEVLHIRSRIDVSMTLGALSDKDYMKLGKLVAKKQPQNAIDLLLEEVPEPTETDYSKIPSYFLIFCRIRQTEPQLLTAAFGIRQSIHEIRLFVAVMIHLYCPEVHLADDRILKNGKRVKPGFAKELARVINRDKGNLSHMINQIPTMEKVYDEFRKEVDFFLTQFKNLQSHGKNQE